MQNDPLAAAVWILDALEKQIQRLAAHLKRGLSDDGDRGVESLGSGRILEGGDGDIAWTVQRLLSNRAEQASGEECSGRENRSWMGRAPQKITDLPVGLIGSRSGRDDQRIVIANAGVLQSLAIAEMTLVLGRILCIAVEQRDAAAAHGNHVLHAFPGTRELIGDDAIQAKAGQFTLHAHDGDPGVAERGNMVVIGMQACFQQKSVHAAAAERGEDFALAQGMVVGVEGNQHVIRVPCRVLRSTNQLSDGGPDDVIYDNSDQICVTDLEAASDVVGMVIELFNDFKHTFPEMIAHRNVAAQDIGNSSDRDPRLCGDFFDGGHVTSRTAQRNKAFTIKPRMSYKVA